ncbi:MAG: hypothetical protein ACRED5_04675 [Propylenella sp.]
MTSTSDEDTGAAEQVGPPDPDPIRVLPPGLPALIGKSPMPPAPVERLDAEPEDAMERFAFALWSAGRKEDAVEFLERQIAREKTGRSPILDVVPSQATDAAHTPVPLPLPMRPFVLAGALAATVIALVLVNVDRSALPDWLSLPQLALWSDEGRDSPSPLRGGKPGEASGEAGQGGVAETERDIASPAETESEPGVVIPASALEPEMTGTIAVPPAVVPAPRAEETAAAEPPAEEIAESEPPTEELAAIEPPTEEIAEDEPPASPAPRAVEIASVEPDAAPEDASASPDEASAAGISALAQRSAEPQPPIPNPQSPEPGPVTLQELAAAVIGEAETPRLPRPRPNPPPGAVAALNAETAPPPVILGTVARRTPTPTPPPPIVGDPLVIADIEPEALPAEPRRLTIIGRVGRVMRPDLIWRRGEARRIAAERRAFAERRAAIRRYQAWAYPHARPYGYPPPPPWLYDPRDDGPYEDDWDW